MEAKAVGAPTDTNRCHSCSEQPRNSSPFYIALKKVIACAIAIYAAYLSLPLFTLSFAFGLGLARYYRQPHTHEKLKNISSCSQSLLENLTGIALPEPVALAGNVAMTIAHLEHHTVFIVPLIGTSIGYSAGIQFL